MAGEPIKPRPPEIPLFPMEKIRAADAALFHKGFPGENNNLLQNGLKFAIEAQIESEAPNLQKFAAMHVKRLTEKIYESYSPDEIIDIGAKKIAGSILHGTTPVQDIEHAALLGYLRTKELSPEEHDSLRTLDQMVKLAKKLPQVEEKTSESLPVVKNAQVVEGNKQTEERIEEVRDAIRQENGLSSANETIPEEPPMPTQDALLQQIQKLAPRTNISIIKSDIDDMVGNFTPYELQMIKDDVSEFGEDARGPEAKDAVRQLVGLLDKVKDPRDFQFESEREVAKAVNPKAFESMDLVVADIGPGSTFTIGKKHYTVEESLGGGAYAKGAYKAKTENGDTVVVKVARESLKKYEKQQFNGEAFTLVRLEAYQRRHDLLVDGYLLTPQFIAAGKTVSGSDFLIMSEAQGKPLGNLIRQGEGSIEDIATVGEQYCRVLEALHGVGKGYHDFQANNIFWNKDAKRITVIDWNLLAPSFSFDGEERFEPDSQKDLYNTGLTLLRLAVPDVSIDQIKNQGPEVALTQVTMNSRLKDVFRNALHTDPTKRYATAQELREAFRQVA